MCFNIVLLYNFVKFKYNIQFYKILIFYSESVSEFEQIFFDRPAPVTVTATGLLVHRLVSESQVRSRRLTHSRVTLLRQAVTDTVSCWTGNETVQNFHFIGTVKIRTFCVPVRRIFRNLSYKDSLDLERRRYYILYYCGDYKN